VSPDSKEVECYSIIGDGSTRFQPVYVIDVVVAIIMALKNDGLGELHIQEDHNAGTLFPSLTNDM
jgi:hypothetical protein